MNAKGDVSRITIDIPKTDHKVLKNMAVKSGLSMRKIVLEFIQGGLACAQSSHCPNKITLKAIKNCKDRKNLVEIKDVRNFFKKLKS